MQFVVVGLGGQGILFSSRVLGHVALSRGERIVGSEVHGMAQRGGSVISHFKIGDYLSPMVKAGEADFLLAFDQGEGIRNLHFLKPGGTALLNVHEPEALENVHLKKYFQERDMKVFPLEGYGILKEHMGGKFLFLNVLLLGALSALEGAGLSYEEAREAIAQLAPKRFVDDNLKVLELGYNAFKS